MLHCFREEEEKTRGARKNLFIWIAILSSNDSNGFSSFKIIKAAVLNTVTLSPCSASLHHFIPVMLKLNFRQPLLQSLVSHDPSEIIQYFKFLWKPWYKETSKEQHLFKIELFFNIINVFTVFKKFFADSQMFELQVYLQGTYNGCLPW